MGNTLASVRFWVDVYSRETHSSRIINIASCSSSEEIIQLESVVYEGLIKCFKQLKQRQQTCEKR